ncbi:intraflagellar transport protein 172 homolog [Photinus pyralis]|nr:intraflagellar transport protein 172 homolog [Photinus pyralis]
MQLKYIQTVIEAQQSESRVVALAWSPNGIKLAVATTDRQIFLYDESGKKRDKFTTKPAESEAGKRSYLIKDICFSPDSCKLAVAQSDCIVYVYKIGEKWGEKKAITNKFLQDCPVICATWLVAGVLVCGLADGKVRALNVKSNKSQTLYSSDSLVVSLAPNLRGTGFLSGHVDGNIIRYFVSSEHGERETSGRVLTHSVPPFALVWTLGQIIAGGCDKRIVVYNNQAKMLKQFDYSKDVSEHEFTTATCSPSGQAVVVGSFDKIRVFSWNSRKSIWDESTSKAIENMYSVTALAWKRDGSRVACGTLCGALYLFETVLKRSVWKDKFEVTYVGPNQVLIKPLNAEGGGVILQSSSGREIEDVRIMGKDGYAVARTDETLLVADLDNNKVSEVAWSDTGQHEKYYFENPNVCLVFNAGELSLIEYGSHEVLCSVRTEFVNPHVISVRLNERQQSTQNKKMAYLLDLKTICVLNLQNGAPVTQISHDSKIDWLELSETGHRLLFRDKKQRLLLVDVNKSEKRCIYSGVSFVQWVEDSDVVVAQAGGCLAVWYNIDVPDHPTILNVQGDVVDIVRANGKTEAIVVDGQNNHTVELDESLVEFGTAIHDTDYGRAVLFLETIENTGEAEAMWHNLSKIALKQQNLVLAERCYAALGDAASAFYLQKTTQIGEEFTKKQNDSISNCSEVWVRLSILNGDLDTAENIYLEQGNIEGALEMYKSLYKWDEAVRLAEQRGYSKLAQLKEDYMSLLLRTGQNEKAGQVFEKQGNYEKAMTLYLKSNCFVRASSLLIQHKELLNDSGLVANVLKILLKHELYESCAEIYEKLQKSSLAMECYQKGKVWSKAIALARSVEPEKVVQLEEEWGDHLYENKQMDAAINHYIEAGRTRKALDAAIGARQWKKAVHIVQVLDESESTEKYYQTIGNHFASARDYSTAEKMYVNAGLYKEAAEMYNEAGQWEKAYSLASRFLDRSEVSEMYLKQAEQLENAGKYRDAEKLYLSVDAPDLAIAMYKRADQYDNMVRLVEKFHPDLLQTTHLHLGQQLETQGKHRAAEVHYLAAGDWKSAMNMYRGLSMWEEAYRVAKQSGGAAAANQVAFLWARTLSIESAIKLLNKFGLLESCVDYACETYQFDFAFQLCKSLTSKTIDVHYKYAIALEDDGKFPEAEAEFVLAGKPKEAILMYTHAQNWINALRVAEIHDPSSVVEVLQAQAAQCFEDKQFAEFESLLLKAQVPEVIVQKYKNEEMWTDAMRICKDHVPSLLSSLQAEYMNSSYGKSSDVSLESLLTQANDWAVAGQHRQAIDCLLQVNASNADPPIIKRALLRAADMLNKFLYDQEALVMAKLIGPRLIEIGEYDAAAQLYMHLDLMKEALDCFVQAEDWAKAKKLAKQLDPAYENYVESKYKDRLLKEGNVEQLADIDIIGALDLLAEQGQWMRCIEKAKNHSEPVLHKYVALYASYLLKNGLTSDALALYHSHGTPAIVQNFNIYTKIAVDVFSQPGMSDFGSFEIWVNLRQMLFDLNNNLQKTSDIPAESRAHFQNLLLIAHFYATRTACRQVSTLKQLALKISIALLRYTDFIPADKAYYEAGVDMRDDGRLSEAFVFLNHYLDICEAIEEGDSQLVDHSDLMQTDFPSNVPLPSDLYLRDELQVHENIREWVLTVSMDQNVEQNLPLDDRELYESSLQISELPCIVSGYPIGEQALTFQSSAFRVNKDVWSKLNMAAKISPESNVSNIIAFIVQWCGAVNK